MKCNKCGNNVAEGGIYCDECGSKLESDSKHGICPNCGEFNDEECVFCGNCGTRLEETTGAFTGIKTDIYEKKVCPICKMQWEGDAEFCGECGTPLLPHATKTEDTPTVPPVIMRKAQCKSCGIYIDSTAELCDSCIALARKTSMGDDDSSGIKSTMPEAKPSDDPQKIANDEIGRSYFKRPEKLD